MRIGIGYDTHRLVGNRKLVIGGVEIAHHLGLLGHSDADVLTHAVMDALLGAAALGDIGQHFPETDQFKDACSMGLLTEVYQMLLKKGYSIVNIDSIIIAEKPRLASYIPKMTENYCRCLGLKPDQMNIKASTEEGMGFVGRQEGISAKAVCLLNRSEIRFV